jgi:putative spermidine/putrescine transport system substrate-binding protein
MRKHLITTTLASAFISAALVTPTQADVTVASWGGAYTMSCQKAWSDTYEPGGINWVNYNGGLGEIRTQVESGNVTWDVVDVLPHEARVGCDEGLFEELPRDVFTPAADGTSMDDDVMVEVPNDCVVPIVFWSYVPFYQKGAFDGNPAGDPKTIEDFFDVEKFPGKRGIHTWGNALVEMALMADGVAPEDVYSVLDTPEGMDRAFAKLDTIKDHAVFWSSGAKPLELVSSGEVSISIAYNGRVGAAILAEDAPFVINWDGQVLEEEWLAMVKGTPNADEALKFMIHASAPEQNAGIAKWITYPPMRASGLKIIEAGEPWYNTGVDIMPLMPTAPAAQAQKYLFADPGWWADNGDSISERFTAWSGQ